MARYECARCHEACFTTDPPHLCSDIRKRHERQAKAVELVSEIIRQRIPGRAVIDGWVDDFALDIVKALSGRDLGT